jgi:hypothetical protein
MLAESRRWLADVEAAEASSRYSAHAPAVLHAPAPGSLRLPEGRVGAGRVHWSRTRVPARLLVLTQKRRTQRDCNDADYT